MSDRQIARLNKQLWTYSLLLVCCGLFRVWCCGQSDSVSVARHFETLLQAFLLEGRLPSEKKGLFRTFCDIFLAVFSIVFIANIE